MKKLIHTRRGDGGAAEDVKREIDLHLDLRAREFEAAGMSPSDARRAALAAFGDRKSIETEVTGMRTDTMREREKREYLAEVRQDVTVAWRMLRRTPVFTIVALLTFALGIGATTAIFGVVRPVLLRPLPYPDADRLVAVWSDHRALGRAAPEWLAPPDFEEWRDGNTTFDAMAAFRGWSPDLTGAGDPVSLSGLAVSGNYLELLGARAAAGRLLSMADDDAGAEPVVVISDGLWRRQFGADPDIVGRTLTLNGESWRVIGVTGADFRPPFSSPLEVFRATRRPPNDGCNRGCVVLRAIGRLKPGVSVAQAQGDLARIAERQAREFPESNAKVGAWLVPLHEQVTGNTKPALLAFGGAVLFVLLIACVNLANLLMVRGTSRARELGVRAALGAGRARIVRQLFVESALLALIGGALGLALGVSLTGALGSLVPASVREVQAIGADAGVVVFALAVTVVAGLLAGLLPALHVTHQDLMSALRSGARETPGRGQGLRKALVVSELALTVVLLVGAGLLLRSFVLMQRVDLGYRADDALVTPIFFPRARYGEPARATAAMEEVLTRLRQHPAIRGVEASDIVPLSGGDQDVTAIAVGEAPRTDGPSAIWYRAVSPGYLQVIGMRLVAGRFFTPDDRAGSAPVAIINEEAARAFWGGKDPVGRVLATSEDPTRPRATVVGVVASARHDGPSQPYKVELFLPMGQFPSRATNLVIVARGGEAAVVPALRQVLREVDPLVPLGAVTPLERMVGESVSLPRTYASLVGAFAAAAMLLAVIGVYGVMAYAVTQRQREIGVRLAMGASPEGIRRLVLGEGGRLAAVGLGVGVVIALMVGQLLGALLFGVSAFDVPTLAGTTLLLGTMTLLASWWPARRAMRVDPLDAMRDG